MTLENWIELIKWIVGGTLCVVAFLYSKWNVIKDTLGELKGGLDLINQRLGYIENDVKKMNENADKVGKWINENHTELAVLRTDLETLKKEFAEWRIK